MDLDPRLQNISAADLQDFAVPHYPNFDQGYQSALYDSGLSEAHTHTAPTHAQAYAQFVADANERPHFAPQSGTSPLRQRTNNNTPLTRSQNVNTQNLTASSINARQHRQANIAQHAVAHFNNDPFSTPTTIQRSNSLQHTPIARPSAPLTQRPNVRVQPAQQQQRQPQSQNQQQQWPQQISNPTSTTTTATPAVTNAPTTQPINPDSAPDPAQFTHPSTFPLIPNPPDLASWREKFFNITEPLILSSEDYHTYFPHVDNIYSHRSTQKYKKKPFVSHYWDCRLKGRPTGTPLSKLRRRQEGKDDEDDEPAAQDEDGDKEVKKRKRKTRERDLCDVKIKVTEYFGRDELEALGKLGTGDEDSENAGRNGQLTFVLEDGSQSAVTAAGKRGSVGQGDDSTFGVLEPMKKLPEGHPGATGKRWYMVQRVNGSGKDDDDVSLDHKHTMEESDRIKKNSVQRWMLAQEKERKKQNRNKNNTDADGSSTSRQSLTSAVSYHASGKAQQTAKSHALATSTNLTLYANSFCPFAQRIWIALELKGIQYQYVEVTPSQIKDGKCILPGLLEVCPEGIIPLLRHGKWAIWESDIVLEYLEDLSIGHNLLPLGDPQLRAHSRLWKDHINRKIVPYFYALLLVPRNDGPQANGEQLQPPVAERRAILVTTLQSQITELVNASHATGPFFLGQEMSLVDVAFAPWIIRLSRVLEHYREFPKPEVGTRWKAWVDAVESDDAVRRTVSDEKSYHAVYGDVGRDSCLAGKTPSPAYGISELRQARALVRQEGFGLGGDVWGTFLNSENPGGLQRS